MLPSSVSDGTLNQPYYTMLYCSPDVNREFGLCLVIN